MHPDSIREVYRDKTWLQVLVAGCKKYVCWLLACLPERSLDDIVLTGSQFVLFMIMTIYSAAQQPLQQPAAEQLWHSSPKCGTAVARLSLPGGLEAVWQPVFRQQKALQRWDDSVKSVASEAAAITAVITYHWCGKPHPHSGGCCTMFLADVAG